MDWCGVRVVVSIGDAVMISCGMFILGWDDDVLCMAQNLGGFGVG